MTFSGSSTPNIALPVRCNRASRFNSFSWVSPTVSKGREWPSGWSQNVWRTVYVRGIGLAVTEATNKASQHVFRKHGFAERVHRSYSDHRLEGQAFFASIADHGGPILMIRSLMSIPDHAHCHHGLLARQSQPEP